MLILAANYGGGGANSNIVRFVLGASEQVFYTRYTFIIALIY